MSRLFLAACALSLLASCGLRGELERPAPMWGDARAQYEREQREKQEQAAQHGQLPAEEQPGVGSGGSAIPVPSH